MTYRGDTDEIFLLKEGYLAQIVTTRGDVFLGTVADVDIIDETVTLENGIYWTYEVAGYVEHVLDKKTLISDEILTCLSNQPLWDIIASPNTVREE